MNKNNFIVDNITWEEYNQTVKNLAKSIIKSLVTFDYICGIARGGLIPAVMLSHILEKPLISQNQLLYGPTTLVVDDIADSGKTLYNYSGYDKIYTATVFFKACSSVVPNFYGKEVDPEHWIMFPYEQKTNDLVSKVNLNE